MSATPQFDHGVWLDLRRLSLYASISTRELREWIHEGIDPLPAYRRGKKLFVNRDEYDVWFRRTSRRVIPADVDKIVREICSGVGAN